MKDTSRCGVLLVVALGLLWRPAHAAEPIAPEVANLWNLLKNSGFEEGGALPSGWGRYPPKDERGNRHLRDSTMAHSGKASGLLWSVAPHIPGKAGIQWNQYGIKVEGGSTLIASFWTRSEGGPPGNGGVHVYDKSGGHLGFTRIPAPSGGKGWLYARQDVPLPPEAAKIGFAAYGADSGKVWFDDAAVIGTPSTQAVRATPKLDGRLDEPCWGRGRALTTFAVHPGTKLPTERTRAWVAYDDNALYVAFHCPHPRGAKLRAKATRHDGDTWLDDSIEVFLDPQHRHNDYFQFCINWRGVIRDSHRTDSGWESGARAAVARGDDGWTIELAIPYDKLGITLDTATTWGINLVRNDRVHGETVTWSLGGFHRPGRFGNVALAPDLIRFFRPALAKRLAELEGRRQLLLGELRAAELPDEILAGPLKLLGEAKRALDGLRAVAEGRVALPQDGWPGVRRRLDGFAATLAGARSAAFKALFSLQGSEKGGLRVAIAHSLQKVRRSGPVLEGVLAQRVRLDAARDEAESFQLVVLPSGRELKGVTVHAPPLRGPGGELPMTWRRVGYVETATPQYPTEFVGWWPDPLLPAAPFDVAADQRQPLWLTVLVPPDARPGLYRGQVTIRCGDSAQRVPVEVRVRNFRLPRPGTLATAFGLYASVLSQWYFGKTPYREKMPIEAFARWCKFLGEYRLSPKNMAREYIKLERDGDAWTADLSALKRTVAPLAPKYFAPYSFCLHRLPVAGVLKRKGAKHDTDSWVAVTKAIAEAWRRERLPEQVYIYGMDEPREQDLPFLAALYRRVRDAAPGFPIMQTIGHPNPQALVGLVDIWCPLTPRLASPFYAGRLKAGDTLWTYVCCGPRPPYANFFIDQPATAHRVLFWQTRQHGATGLLYWCVGYWNGLPNAASGKPCFPEIPIRLKELGTYKLFKVNGDGVLVYPGPKLTPWPSIRLEIIRDGIEDYEYLALLDRTVKQAAALPAPRRPAAQLLKQARALCRVPKTISRSLTDYTKEPGHILERRRQIADMIERLTGALALEHNAARKTEAQGRGEAR